MTTEWAAGDGHEAWLRAELVEAARRLHQAGLIAATEGNLSARLGPGRFLTTPAGVSKGHLGPADLVVVDEGGRPLRPESPAPSSEWKMHAAIYRARPDVAAVVHAHPPYATAFAAAGQTLDAAILPEAFVLLGPVAHVPYATPGTDELPAALSPFLAAHDAYLLASHGATTCGPTVSAAFYRMEVLEHLARTTWLARALGGAVPLGAERQAQLVPVRARLAHGSWPPLKRRGE